MNRNRIGFIAGVLGSAIGAWWWSRQRGRRAAAHHHHTREHGTVIYSNTPTAAPGDVF